MHIVLVYCSHHSILNGGFLNWCIRVSEEISLILFLLNANLRTYNSHSQAIMTSESKKIYNYKQIILDE